MSNRSCPQCGAPLPDNARFCGQCGNVLRTDESATSPPAGAAVKTPVAPPPGPGAGRADMSRTMLDPPPRFEPDVHEEVTVARPMPDLSTLLDAVPSERLDEPNAPPAQGAEKNALAQTLADPEAIARAREMLDAALPPTEATMKSPRQAMGQTMALGQMPPATLQSGPAGAPEPRPSPASSIPTPYVSQVPEQLAALR
ncbi:MAG: zinc-ribbon domain-containing protein, partial [Myxococcales bacterium]|nr:zinc-ribbon domain-containing protein [Myxococcales bacterium]